MERSSWNNCTLVMANKTILNLNETKTRKINLLYDRCWTYLIITLCAHFFLFNYCKETNEKCCSSFSRLKIKMKKVGTALLYIRCREGNCKRCIQFEFNDDIVIVPIQKMVVSVDSLLFYNIIIFLNFQKYY